MEAVTQTCAQCGWSFDTEALQTNTCKKCKSAILVDSVALLEKFEPPAVRKYIARYAESLKADPCDRDSLLGMGICYLRLRQHDVANRFFGQLVEVHPADPAGYYYRAFCTLRGVRPRCATLKTVREAEGLLETASSLDPANGRYEFALALLRHDYYMVNGLRCPAPDPDKLIAAAQDKYLDRVETEQIGQLLGMGDGH
jgi:hypothetical protein